MMFGKHKMSKENNSGDSKAGSMDQNVQTSAQAEVQDANTGKNTPDQPQASTAKAPKEKTEKKTTEETLKNQIAELEKKVADTENRRLLALAEMDNQRKRFAREMENLRYHVIQDTLFPFLQVFDHFSMAVNAAEKAQNVEALKKGMDMIQQEFDKAFSDLGVEKIDASGKDFDPKLHEAVSQEPSDTTPAGKVLRQWNMGYRMGDRLLKPAMVIVSSGPGEKEGK